MKKIVVNGFWHDSELGELEKLCIDSWIKNGYEFHLWIYDDIEVPNGVVVKNASEIVYLNQYFTYDGGVSKGTPVAFSNLFRTRLLYKLGGLYTDLDVFCLKPYDFNERFVFSEQGDSTRNYHVATCILYSKNKGEKIFDDWSDWILSLKYETITHGDLGPNLFTKLIIDNKLEKYVLSKEYFCPVDWELYKDVLEHNFDSYGVHLYRSLWNEKESEKLVNRYL
jgi:mannosyltransferase OCH1-like enzyme|tara:strand:+ start:386 stop:1057 length:672 start_codon:yes stop_codon:yes gene_type:complete